MVGTMALAENLKRLRSLKGISQQELAAAIGVSHPRISELESGNANPKLSTIESIAAFFGVTAARLLQEPKKRIAKSA